jgi:prepilin-type N-terminal cleavage/methylation domain-containing protein
MTALPARAGGRIKHSDSGVTLIELIVSLTIMAVVMTMFTTGVLQMYQAANKTESLSNAQSELNTVFLRLDRLVRYASGISDVKKNGNNYYVGLLSVESDTPRCNALRLVGNEKKLQMVTWIENDPTKRPPWTTLANDVLGPNVAFDKAAGRLLGGQPFTLVEADATENFDRLQLDLTAVTGSNDASATKTTTSVRFTALNTSLATATPTVCTTYEGTP